MSEQTEQPEKKIYYDDISVAQRTTQIMHVVDSVDKASMLAHILKSIDDLHAVVITKTKRNADALSIYLQAQKINAAAIHSNKRAQENDAVNTSFESGEVTVLITTDMILQSLELTNITHMISYDLPLEPTHYLSRVGSLNERGISIALLSEDQETQLLDIERFMRHEMQEKEVEGYTGTPESDPTLIPKPAKDQKKKPRHRKQKRKAASKTDQTDNKPLDDEQTEK